MPDPSEGTPSSPEPAAAVLFDLDDTLVAFQTVPHWQWAWKPNGPVLNERHARSAIGKSVRAWDRRRWRGLVGSDAPVGSAEYRLHLRETLLAIAGRPLPEDEIESVLDRFLKPSPLSEPYPDLRPALAELKKRAVKLAVLTPLGEPQARPLLTRSGVPVDVPILGTSASGGPMLPDAAAFREARKTVAKRGERVLYVGNLYWSDVRAAARAGLEAVLLDRLGLFEGLGGERIGTLTELPTRLDAAPPVANPAGPTAPDSDDRTPAGSTTGADASSRTVGI